MALKAVLNDSSALTDALKPFYVEKDGKFVLDVEPVEGFALEDVTGLKSALGSERTAREKAEKKIAKFADLDPDKAREALAKLDEISKFDPEKEADKIAAKKLESATSQLLEKHTQELGAKEQRITTLSGAVDKLLRKSAATQAIADAKGAVDLLLPHVLEHTRVKETDTGFEVEVIDEKGNVKIADGKGTPMTIEGLVAEMRQSEKFGRAFEASGQSGSGKRPGQGAGGAGATKKSDFKNEKERAAWVDANGFDAYQALPD